MGDRLDAGNDHNHFRINKIFENKIEVCIGQKNSINANKATLVK